MRGIVDSKRFGDAIGAARFLGHAPSATQQSPHPVVDNPHEGWRVTGSSVEEKRAPGQSPILAA